MDYPEREGGNAKRNLSKMYVDELTFGLPPSRLGNAHASMALRSAWRRFNLNIVVPLTVVDLRRDSAMPESELSPLRSLLRRLTAALIGLSVLCWTAWRSRLVRALGIAIASVVDFVFLLRASAIRKRAFMAFGLASVLLSLIASCASSRKATSSLQLTAYGLHETRDTVREQVMVAVHDTIREVTTITVQTNDAGDTLKVVQITDRDRARNREAVRDKEARLVVRTDTVYVEKRDSSLQVLGRAKRQSRAKAYGLQEDGTPTVSGKLSAVSKILKWIFWIIIGLIGLIVTAKVCEGLTMADLDPKAIVVIKQSPMELTITNAGGFPIAEASSAP